MSSDQPHSRRWSRLLDFLPTRRRRATPTTQPHASTDVVLPRRARRNRNRRSTSDHTSQSHSSPVLPTSAIYPHSFPTQSSDDTSEDSNTPSPTITHSTGRQTVASNTDTADSPPFSDHYAVQDNDLFAVFNRIFDDYQANAPSDYEPPALYFGRLTQHPTRHRVAIRIPNAYYYPNRRQARHSQLTTELEREFRLMNMRTAVRMTASASTSTTYDTAASDAQIEALPTFVMEKGETRSVQQIFASMKHNTVGNVDQHIDECGGLMTSYTECAICLSDFEPGDEITALPCGHFFHLTGCVREWLRNHARTCPTCRADICVKPASSEDLGAQSPGIAAADGRA